MSKTIAAGFRTHLDLEVTELISCIYIRRRDSTEFRFTEFDRDLVIPGPELDARGRDISGTYEASVGETPSSIASSAELNVDNLDMMTVIDNAGITEADMTAGVWDYADFNIFQVVHSDLTLGVMYLMSGKLGEVTITRGTDMGTVELRSKSTILQERIGRLVSHECPVDLGSIDCKALGLPPAWVASTAYALGDRVRPVVWERKQFVCTTAGTSGSSEPVWDLRLNQTTTDSTATWTTFSPLQPPTWTASRAYALDDRVSPTTADGRLYKCTTAGTSAGSEPTWNTTVAGTTSDGSVTWTTYLATLWSGTVDSVTDRKQFADSTLNDAATADDYFKYGLLTWTVGLNAGLQSEIKSYTQSTGELVLWTSMPYTIATSDEFVVEAGCDKARATCRDKFANLVNFQGFPWVAGRDAMFQTPGAKA